MRHPLAAMTLFLLTIWLVPHVRAAGSGANVGGANKEAAPAGNTATQALHKLFAAEWDYTMQENPTWASSLGDRRWNDRWEDESLANHEKQQQHGLAVLEKLKHIQRAQLSAADQLNYDLFQKDYAQDAAEHKYQIGRASCRERV